ncbi:HU family DNA-binding protein [Bacteroides timonensis]|uniref:HU family DNA-binding protein n=1 Tax=Bacteroides timonensis TaxID=1470345 RepID=UPI0004B3E2A5|nr:HU family DNA-binding protein [Bacteroides timonensis]
MTKADVIKEIVQKTGIDQEAVSQVVEAMMSSIKEAMAGGDEVFLRGFGSFIIKRRAEKMGRNISQNTSMIIPAHNIPAFKPAESFVKMIK